MGLKKPAVKPVAKPTAKDKSKVDNDPLADLGLGTPTTKTVAPVAAKAAKVVAAAPVVTTPPVALVGGTDTEGTDVSNDEVDVGEIEFGFDTFIPTAKRKAEGSKYKFDKLPAPDVFADGPNKGKPKIANFKVLLQPGVDADKLRRSVQSATTQANRQGSDAGKYFVSRTLTDDNGKFSGMVVYRTDAKPTK